MKQKMKRFLNFRKNSNTNSSNPSIDQIDTSEIIAQNFKQLTTILSDSQSIDDCVNYYLEKVDAFYNDDDEKQHQFIQINNLLPNITSLLHSYAPFFEMSINDNSKWESGFGFLISVLKYITPEQSNKSIFYDLIYTILNSNNENLIVNSKEFFLIFLNLHHFSNDLLKKNNLVKIWQGVFVKNEQSSLILGDSFINRISEMNYTNITDIQSFLDDVLLTLNKQLISPIELVSKALEFICKIMKCIDTDPFIDSLIDSIRPLLFDIPDLSFFKSLLELKTTRQTSLWEAINMIFQHQSIGITKIRLFIDLFKSVDDISLLKTGSLLPWFKYLSSDDQWKLMEIIKRQSIDYKFAFVCSACPPWKNNVNPEFYELVLISGKYDETQIQMLLDLYLTTGDEFYEHITQVKRSIVFLLSTVTQDMTIVSKLLSSFLLFLNHDLLEEESRLTVFDLVKKLFMTGNHDILTTTFLTFLTENNDIKDDIFELMSHVSIEYEDVCMQFRTKNVFPFIEKHFNHISCIDFLASLANDGPYKEIDDFINSLNVTESILTNLNLVNLIQGLPQTSSYSGLIRIPSLCKYVDEIPINTPFDKYIIATTIKDLKPSIYTQCSSFYINTDTIPLDSSFLRNISDPELFHFSVYQLHYSMKHSYAPLPNAVTCSFWIYFEKLINETICLSSPKINVIVGLEEIRVNQNEPFAFPLMKWNLLTIVRNSHTFGVDSIEIYLNDKKIFGTELKNSNLEQFRIGSDTNNYAIWYISQSIQTMNVPPLKSDLLNLIQAGPSSFSSVQLDCSPGMHFLQYRGIVSFQDTFNMFELLLSSKTQSDFINYLHVANNLTKIGVISKDKYYSAVRYIVGQKLINNEIDSGIEEYLHSVEFFLDYQLLGIDALSFDWIRKEMLSNANLMSSYVYPAIDALLFLNLNENKCHLLVEIISKYAVEHPDFILTIFILIELMNNNIDMQQRFFHIFIRNFELFQPYVSKTRLYQLMQNLDDDKLVLEIWDFLSPNYFDIGLINESMLRFIPLTKYESFWFSMFSFLVGVTITECLNDSTNYPVKQTTLIPTMLKLVTYSLRFELSTKVLKNLSILLNSINICQYVNSIRLLCSLGYRNPIPTKYPFKVQLLTDEQIELSSEQSSETDLTSTDHLIEDEQDDDEEQVISSTGISNVSNTFANKVPTNYLPKYYDETVMYMYDEFKVNEDNVSQVIQSKTELIQLFEPECHELTQLDFTNIEIIAEICSNLLKKSAKTPIEFKSNLIKLTIQGAEVPKPIAVLLHHEIVLRLIIHLSNIPTKSNEIFGHFLINHICEGWWDENIFEIYISMSRYFCNNSFTKDFFLACMLKLDNLDSKKKLLELFIHNASLKNPMQLFSDLVSKDPFQGVIIEILTRSNLIDYFKDTILSTFPKNSEFIQTFLSSATSKNCYIDSIHKILKNANINNKMVIEKRNNLTTPSQVSNIQQFYRTVTNRIEYNYVAFKCQFYCRLNRSNMKIENFLSDFLSDQYKRLLPKLFNYVVAPSSKPLTVPQKLIPISFKYEIPFNSTKCSIPVVHYSLQDNLKNLKLKDENDELLRERKLPSSFHSLLLQSRSIEHKLYFPTFSMSLNITKLFKKVYEPSNNSTRLFQCNFLSYIEPIPCTGLFTKDDHLVILMNSQVTKENGHEKIELINDYEKTNFDNPNSYSYSSIPTDFTFTRIVEGYFGKWELFMNHIVIKVPFNEIYCVLPRKHTHLNIALDVFTLYGCHFSFLFSERERKQYLSKVKPLQLVKSTDVYTKQWLKGELTNLDYLLILNLLGSRSFNDLSQYPVFPWILSDYLSDQLDTQNLQDNQLRRLERPIGIQTDDRIDRFLVVYNEMNPPYHYGTHYSYPAAVLHFMIRVDPSTKLAFHIHGGWDRQDRIFWDIQESWRSVTTSMQTDVKELIPEFYTFPSFLENINQLDLPNRSDGHSLKTVNLPPWAKNTPFNFIWLMRDSLESIKVRKSLHAWIDLIFGFKQRGQPAVDAVNVYQSYCYGSNKNKDKEEDDELTNEADYLSMINFGMCPTQLFLYPHPSFNEPANSPNLLNDELKITNLIQFPQSITTIRYDSNKKLFQYTQSQELFFNFPDKIQFFSNYAIITCNSSATPSNIMNTERHSSIGSIPQTSIISSLTSSTFVFRFADLISCFCSSYSSQFIAVALLNNCIHVIRPIIHSNQNSNDDSITNNETTLTVLSNSKTQLLICKEKVLAMAISEKHFILAVATLSNNILLFDITSGRQIRDLNNLDQIHFNSMIEQLIFDDSSDLLIVVPQNASITALRLDLQLVAISNDIEADSCTAIDVCNSTSWNPFPFFITGHLTGAINMWKIDVQNNVISKLRLVKTNNRICAIDIFYRNKAVIAVDETGKSVMISIRNIHNQFLNKQYFDHCSICNDPNEYRKANLCSHCGLAMCNKCFEKKTNCCTQCNLNSNLLS